MPVTKFCEWTADPDPVTKRKAKVWFSLNDEPLFAFAGIWRPGEDGAFMAFLTCEPNATVGAVHPKAMPVILQPSDFRRWLDNERDEACGLARPLPDDLMAPAVLQRSGRPERGAELRPGLQVEAVGAVDLRSGASGARAFE